MERSSPIDVDQHTAPAEGGSIFRRTELALDTSIAMSQENPFEIAQHQFDIAATMLNLHQELRETLRNCKRELTVTFPVGMDDGSVRVLRGYRIQHNIARGPA